MSVESPVPVPPRARLNFWAILLGTVVDFVSTALGAALLLVFVAGDLTVMLAFGLTMTAWGGYVAAAVAGRRSLAHGVGVGVLSAAGGLVLQALGGDEAASAYPLWHQILGYLLTIPAAVGGAWVRRRFSGERLPTDVRPQPGVYPGLGQAIWLALLTVVVTTLMIIGVAVPAAVLSFVGLTSWLVPTIVAGAIAGYILILAWAVRKSGAPAVEVFPVRRVPLTWLWPGLITIAGIAILFGELTNLIRRLLPPPTLPFDLTKLFDITVGSQWAAIAFIVVLGPVVEELLFRGVILRGFLSRYSVRKAIIASALLFGAYHLNPFQFVTATTLGVVFGWWRVQTGSLVLPFLGHALNNALAISVPRLPWVAAQPLDILAVPPFQPVWFDVLGVVLVVVGLVQFTRAVRNRSPDPVPSVITS